MGAQHPEVFGSAVHGHVLLGGMDTIILRDPGRPCQDRKRLREVPQAFPLVHWKRGGGHIQTDSGLFPVILPELGAKGNRQSGRLVAYPNSFGKVKGWAKKGGRARPFCGKCFPVGEQKMVDTGQNL